VHRSLYVNFRNARLVKCFIPCPFSRSFSVQRTLLFTWSQIVYFVWWNTDAVMLAYGCTGWPRENGAKVNWRHPWDICIINIISFPLKGGIICNFCGYRIFLGRVDLRHFTTVFQNDPNLCLYSATSSSGLGKTTQKQFKRLQFVSLTWNSANFECLQPTLNVSPWKQVITVFNGIFSSLGWIFDENFRKTLHKPL